MYNWTKLYGYQNAGMKNIQNWRDKLTAGDKTFMLNFWQNKKASNIPITDVTADQIAYAKCDILGDARENLKCLKKAGLPAGFYNELGNFMDFYLTLT